MNLLQIQQKISDGKNLIFYKKSVYDCYEELQDDYLCIYFNEPTPVKARLQKIINTISDEDKPSLYRKTIAELKEILIKELKYERLIITFNHFDRLTKRTVQVYESLNSLKNIQFICSFTENFKSEIYSFYNQFEFVNKKEYEKVAVKDEINVTYAAYIFISIYSFFLYLKVSPPPYFNPFSIVSAIWIAIIIFRTLMYVGGRP